MTEFVRLEVDGGIGVVRLDRPPMNAISRQVQEELVATAAEAANRADVRAVVVYGGEKVLAAGADVKEMATMEYADMAAVARRVSAGFGAMATIPKPTASRLIFCRSTGASEQTCLLMIAASVNTKAKPSNWPCANALRSTRRPISTKKSGTSRELTGRKTSSRSCLV